MKLPIIERLRRFYRRNDIIFWCTGLIVSGHIVWWQLQQNRKFVAKKDRLQHLGPFEVPYLDETEFYKKRKLSQELPTNTTPPKAT
jgi:hypothetical protein